MVDIVENKIQLHISVRNLVEFIFREGDIDNRFTRLASADAMLMGTRIHRKIQKSMGPEYQYEVPLKYTLSEDLYDLVIDGRADGIFIGHKREEDWEKLFQEEVYEEGTVYIDEIKGMLSKVENLEEPYYIHKAQAMCYGYIFAYENMLSRIGIQMTYCNMETEELKYFRQVFTFEEIESWFMDMLSKYKLWANFQCQQRISRQKSIKNLQFPFEYRQGQKKLVTDVYKTILRKKNLFLQAPTGVGKTISTIFPAVKAVGENLGDKIFYLTAKTITATVAMETFGMLIDKGYRAKVIQLTAKEKLCLCEEMDCNPVNCPYAKGHYDRVNDAVFDLIKREDVFTREVLIGQAEKYQVCPFEMSLDVSLWCDDIICDYNYVFDPLVFLKRFFQEGIKGDYIFLVDEAHNLVERSREMYSAQIYKEDFLMAKRILKNYSKKLEKTLDRCNKQLLNYKRECENYVIYENVGALMFSLMRLSTELDEFLQKPIEFTGKKDILEFYFSVKNFINIYDLVDEHYVIYTEQESDGRFMLKLFCVDPSLNLQNCIDKGNSTIFFSATLLPINYYKSLLSTDPENYAVYAESTFSMDQRLLAFGKDVSTKYTRRNENEYSKISNYVWETVKCKKGNYMVFFPSYKLMQEVYQIYRQIDTKSECIMQSSGMTEIEREDFLLEFEAERDESMVAFCVMGGIFGEGIDLTNDKLIGAIIVGTGLPQVSNEREILKNYYDDNNHNGFDYAFRYPGMNKVLQAAGRVIRTTDDRGIILLLDERFLKGDYEPLFPREWEKRLVCGIEDLGQYINSFWKENSDC